MAPMTYRRRSAMPLQHATLRVALVLMLVLLAGCSSLAGPQEGAATAPLNSDYRRVIDGRAGPVIWRPFAGN